MTKPTDVSQFVEELGAGVTQEKLAHIITTVTGAVMQHSKDGEVNLKLKFKRASNSSEQVMVTHALSYKQPKKRGHIAEVDEQDTIMYVNEGNNPTQFPENQVDMFNNEEARQHAD